MKNKIFFSVLLVVLTIGVRGQSNTGYQDVKLRKLNCETTMDGTFLNGLLIDGYEVDNQVKGFYSILDLRSEDSSHKILVLNSNALSQDPQKLRDQPNTRTKYDFALSEIFQDARGVKDCGKGGDRCLITLKSNANQTYQKRKQYEIRVTNVDESTRTRTVLYKGILNCQ